MIDSKALLADLKKQLKLLQADLRVRAEDPADTWGARLREQHRVATGRGRTGHAWVTWRDGEVDQAAVAWLVATTFVRFCEDNSLLDGARDDEGRSVPTLWLAGPGQRRDLAVEHETEFFTRSPSANRRDWVLEAFRVLAAQPAGRALVDPDHALVWRAEIGAEAADGLVAFWRQTDAAGDLVHDFTDAGLDTRFLGDLYQDLSDYAKKTFALLQTPDFVEEFILDQTFDPALAEFGLDGFRGIDPTCGSGHFLLGMFNRLERAWADQAPGLDVRERVQKAMRSVHGVDLNPFAVAIARFRLTVAGLKAIGARSLVEAPAFEYSVAIGDSLLASRQLELDLGLHGEGEGFAYDVEDVADHPTLLKPGTYHCVVGNPPYITPKDKALNAAYREGYQMCSGKYALSVPFMELFFRLAVRGAQGQPAGHVGQITANSFMKREFGKKVIEVLLAGRDLSNPVDLTHVIDTSGAYIPGHGTPTVILVGRRRRAESDTIRAVLGVRGEPGQPEEPAKGRVWTEIVENLDGDDHDGAFVSVVTLQRVGFQGHPWSLGGGGASSLQERLESVSPSSLQALDVDMGMTDLTGEDEAFVVPGHIVERLHWQVLSPILVEGDQVRDFLVDASDRSLLPNTLSGTLVEPSVPFARWLWRLKANLSERLYFGKRPEDRGKRWFDHAMFFAKRHRTPLSITFAEVATHNHFVLDRGGKVFKQTAPVIKLPEAATEQDHLDLLGVLNSSTACFWLKQVCHCKGSTVDSKGARQTQVPWEDFYQFNSTKVSQFPLPSKMPRVRGQALNELAEKFRAVGPAAALDEGRDDSGGEFRLRLAIARQTWERLRGRLIFEQEELDWEVYRLYGLVDEDLTYTGALPVDGRLLHLGQRAFEVALARAVEAGTEETAWFTRHGSTPITGLPDDWPEDYRRVVERRLELIASDKSIGLLERPEFKRRWATVGWDALLTDALREAVLDRLEERDLWFDATGTPQTQSVAQLADDVRHDQHLIQLLGVLSGSDDVTTRDALVALFKDEPVPYLAALRLKEQGVEKYRAWQQTWALQRREDAGERVDVEVPPKYAQADFAKPSYWKARGKLDVPKERFIGYPGAVRAGDGTAVLGWAGWDHAEQAQALAREIGTQQGLGAGVEDLTPLVAGLVELEPWLAQWHGELDPRYGTSPAAAISGMVDQLLGQLDVTRDALDAWRPPAPTRGRRANGSTGNDKVLS